ncbi:hypothetical protein BDA99DRAFT_509007 [Phascolomyces articulosus]|uniref:F-box domain-containing protein n=1 Tax=Phascolomyces articulosus TaxID=60185 RepID=A0AAD5KAN7_9FUNG|nr:hypothetical protein BDA99DRAFT_509007 [Phascolomyces articulosus]
MSDRTLCSLYHTSFLFFFFNQLEKEVLSSWLCLLLLYFTHWFSQIIIIIIMRDFTHLLPPEIVSHVLLYLDQKDSIECMTVCHRWFELFPKYTTPIWNQLNINNKSWRYPNHAMLLCLGSHVKTVSIKFLYTWPILQQLARLNCGIQSLKMVHYDFRYYDMDKWPATLGLFANTLTELVIDYQQYDISLTMLLDTLPALTHLTVELVNTTSTSLIVESSSNNSTVNSHSSNIVYLCLDSLFKFNVRIHPVLRRCPQLKFLLISNFNKKSDHQQHTLSLPEIQTTLDTCPHLQYISTRQINVEYLAQAKKLEKRWIKLSKENIITPSSHSDNNDINHITIGTASQGMENRNKAKNNIVHQVNRGLCEFEFTGDIQQAHMTSILTQSQQTLEHLHFSFVDAEQITHYLLKHEHFPQLKSIELTSLYNLTENIKWIYNDMFHLHYRQIEHLYLDLNGIELQNDRNSTLQELLDHLVEAASQMSKLRYLILDFEYDCYVECNNLDLLVTTTRNNNNNDLRFVILINIPISDKELLALGHLPQLRSLQLWGCDTHRQLTEEGFIAFANVLINKKTNSKIKYMGLHCDDQGKVTDMVLGHLVRIESLKTLRIANNNDITDDGVNLFGKKKKLELNACQSVSPDNSNAIFLNESVANS